jgi:chromosome segregation protein
MTNDNQSKLTSLELDFQQYESIEKGNVKDFENEINQKTASLQTKYDQLNSELNVLRQQKLLLRSKQNDYESRNSELHAQLDRAREVLITTQSDKIKCENILTNAKDKINQQYKMTLDFVKENYSDPLPISDEQARGMIIQLQNEIDQLGDINFEAIRELEDRQTNFEKEQAALEELKTARDKIRDVIHKLDAKAKKDFAKIINNVNETLPLVFRHLFGGGTCDIVLTNPDDYLTTGIDISVTIPGKVPMGLDLLSGGEKSLVTLSILFSILKSKSFPMVILDEADHALDPGNIVRYAQIIKEYSDKTQFIVITHHEGTME